ncbi:hypothetical protein [Sciscionella sediminilitoris]|uniref:hypothetical protein n=1 Tax=Sciscionella sediminilitoris TaxID=1445613 RepID=UPI0004DFA61E|nr:hypothetical protein [Sciscionella sp. SE31]
MFAELVVLGVRTGAVYRIDTENGNVTTIRERGGWSPDGVVVENGTIYWTTMGKPVLDPEIPGEAGMDYTARDGGLHAMRLDGTEVRDVLAPGTITTGKQLASDRAGTLYWGDREGFRVSRVRADGTGLTDLVVNTPDASGLQECVGVAVDRAAGYLYWTQKGPSKGGAGRILRAGLEIPGGETAATRSDIEVLWDGLPEPIDLELRGGWLYWTDRGAEPAGNTLNRAPVPAAGEKGAEPEILAGGFSEAIGLAVDTDRAYVSDLGGRISVVPLPEAGGGEARVFVRLRDHCTGLAGIGA